MNEYALTFPLLKEMFDSQQANGRHQVSVRAVEEDLSKNLRWLWCNSATPLRAIRRRDNSTCWTWAQEKIARTNLPQVVQHAGH